MLRTPSPLPPEDPRRYLLSERQEQPVGAEVPAVWQHVRDQVSRTLPRGDYETWIAPCSLIALEDGLAVVATPNVFVREEVQHRYKAQLEAVMSQVCAGPTNIQVVIGTA